MTIFKTLYIFLIYIQDFLKILTLKAFKGNDKDISGKKKNGAGFITWPCLNHSYAVPCLGGLSRSHDLSISQIRQWRQWYLLHSDIYFVDKGLENVTECGGHSPGKR